MTARRVFSLTPLLFLLALGCGDRPTEPVDHPLVGSWISQDEMYTHNGVSLSVVTSLNIRPDGTADLTVRSFTNDEPDYPKGTVVMQASGIWQERDGTLALVWDQMDGETRSYFQDLDAWWWPDRIVVSGGRTWIFSRTEGEQEDEGPL